jgi:hypothetical protein
MKQKGGSITQRCFYKFSNGSDEFFVTIQPELQFFHQYTIFVSGIKKGCVNAVVYTKSKPNSRIPQTKDIRQGYIQHIQYSKKCNVNGNLNPGLGTIKMIHALFSVTRSFFPWVESYTFEDMSRIRCSKGNYMDLAVYNLAFHGKTWFDVKFQARKLDESAQEIYMRDKFTLQQPKRLTWDKVKASIPPEFHKTFKSLYEDAISYAEFFKGLNS